MLAWWDEIHPISNHCDLGILLWQVAIILYCERNAQCLFVCSRKIIIRSNDIHTLYIRFMHCWHTFCCMSINNQSIILLYCYHNKSIILYFFILNQYICKIKNSNALLLFTMFIIQKGAGNFSNCKMSINPVCEIKHISILLNIKKISFGLQCISQDLLNLCTFDTHFANICEKYLYKQLNYLHNKLK